MARDSQTVIARHRAILTDSIPVLRDNGYTELAEKIKATLEAFPETAQGDELSTARMLENFPLLIVGVLKTCEDDSKLTAFALHIRQQWKPQKNRRRA